MTLSTRRRALRRLRPAVIGLIAAMMTVLAPGIAHAAPPSNDDFDAATTVTALPFTAQTDTTDATEADDDPTGCYYWGIRSVWFRYTAPTDGFVKAIVPRAQGQQYAIVAVYTGGRGALSQLPGACSYPVYTGAETFHVTAGETYHIMVFELYQGLPHTVEFTAVQSPPNDDFASGTAIGLPTTHQGDLAAAWSDPGEVTSSCAPGANKSLWYRYTPDRTRWVALEARVQTISVHRGTDLSEVDCSPEAYLEAVSVFKAEAGQTYHIRVAADAVYANQFTLGIRTAPSLAPAAPFHPDDPSIHDDISFSPYSGDPLGRDLVSGEVRFGDGSSAPVTGGSIRHRYAADGDYQLEVTGSTNDGRTATGVRTVHVETHDVTVTGFTVPASAQAGQTKSIKASVVNSRYDENVQVQLQRKNVHGQYDVIGTLNQQVAAGRAIEFPFAYTYTAADATAGKVTFRVVATLPNRYLGDSNPADNERAAETTKVRPKAGRAV